MKTALVLLAILCVMGPRSWAQEFAPPPPPPLDDYEDLDDEGFETDEAFRPPPPPPLPPGAQTQNGSPPPPPPPDFKASNESYISQPGKFRFRIVEGEFWEKGKKRSRGRQIYGRSTGN